jgi:hypothetical protein
VVITVVVLELPNSSESSVENIVFGALSQPDYDTSPYFVAEAPAVLQDGRVDPVVEEAMSEIPDFLQRRLSPLLRTVETFASPSEQVVAFMNDKTAPAITELRSAWQRLFENDAASFVSGSNEDTYITLGKNLQKMGSILAGEIQSGIPFYDLTERTPFPAMFLYRVATNPTEQRYAIVEI